MAILGGKITGCLLDDYQVSIIVITESCCGYAVEPANPKSFAEALEMLADNPELTKQMGINARTLAVREFDRKELGDRFVDFLEKVYQH